MKQSPLMINKFKPVAEKEYVVTDQCGWERLTEDEQCEYNPYDKSRKPHAIQLVDVDTGTVVELESGSIVRIVKARESEKFTHL